MNLFLLLFGWLLYFYLHSLLAATSVKQFLTQHLSISSARVYRIGYNMIALTGIVGLLYLQYITPSALLFLPVSISFYMALLLMATGFVIMLVAIKNYNWKSFLGITAGQTYSLVIAGMNKYVRHPLYSGTMLFVTGFFLWQPYVKNILLLVMMMMYLVIGIWYEEKKLLKDYGEAYKNYQRTVKKMIPFIW